MASLIKTPPASHPARPRSLSEIELAHYDNTAFKEIHNALRAQFQPANPFEDFYVLQMANAQWRIPRFNRIEAGVLDFHALFAHYPGLAPHHALARTLADGFSRPRPGAILETLNTHENSLRRAVRELTRADTMWSSQGRQGV